MSEKLEFTKNELIQAFMVYNKEAIETPEDFTKIDTSEDCAKVQVEVLLGILEKIQSQNDTSK